MEEIPLLLFVFVITIIYVCVCMFVCFDAYDLSHFTCNIYCGCIIIIIIIVLIIISYYCYDNQY